MSSQHPTQLQKSLLFQLGLSQKRTTRRLRNLRGCSNLVLLFKASLITRHFTLYIVNKYHLLFSLTNYTKSVLATFKAQFSSFKIISFSFSFSPFRVSHQHCRVSATLVLTSTTVNHFIVRTENYNFLVKKIVQLML